MPNLEPGVPISNSQYEQIMSGVLDELCRTRIPPFDYETRVRHSGYHLHYLEELVPRAETPKRFLRSEKEIHRIRGRLAIALTCVGTPADFVVYQPRWFVPLTEELEAISSVINEQPRVSTNYVESWYLPPDGYVETGELVPEIQTELSELRRQYWTAKVAELQHPPEQKK